MSAWRICGRWTATGKESSEEFVVLTRALEPKAAEEEARRQALHGLVRALPADAGKVILEVVELERLGAVRGSDG